MKEEIKSTVGFSIFIDEDISDALTFVIGSFLDAVKREPLIMIHPEFQNRMHGIEKLLDQVTDKVHELGWCKDPDCDYKKDEKPNNSL